MSKVTKGFGTKIAYSDVDDDNAPTGEYTEFARVTNINGLEVDADDIEVSHLQSPNQFKEWIAGWADGGETEVDIQFHKSSAGAIWALFRQSKSFRITFIDGSTWVVCGFIKKFGNEVEKDKIVMLKLKLKVSGEPVFTAAA